MEHLEEAFKTLYTSNRVSYSLRLVLSVIKSVKKECKGVKVETKLNFPVIFTNTGVQLSFVGTEWSLSIQTRTEVTGPAFCESALLHTKVKGCAYEGELGYGDVIRHHDPQDLRVHLVEMFTKLPTFKLSETE